MVQPCEENERGAHSEKNARCGQTRKIRRKRPILIWKCACKMDMIEAVLKEDNSHNATTERCRMEEADKQLYRRLQMMGQAREEEEDPCAK